MRGAVIIVGAALAVSGCSHASSSSTGSSPSSVTATTSDANEATTTTVPASATLLLATHDNAFVAYSTAAPVRSQVVVASRASDSDGFDSTGQVCTSPSDPHRVAVAVSSERSGWQVMRLAGGDIGNLRAALEQRLPAPTLATPVGCAFLDDGRLLTTDTGGTDATKRTGRLVEWFAADDDTPTTKSCLVDDQLGGVGQLLVDHDRVFVATAQGRGAQGPGVYEYDAATLPARVEDCSPNATGLGGNTAIVPTRFVKTGASNGVRGATAIARASNGDYLTAGSLGGAIVRVDPSSGAIRQFVLRPTRQRRSAPTPFRGGTPVSLSTDDSGVIYYADRGLKQTVSGAAAATPGLRTATLRRIDIVDGVAKAPVVVAAGLTAATGVAVWVSPNR